MQETAQRSKYVLLNLLLDLLLDRRWKKPATTMHVHVLGVVICVVMLVQCMCCEAMRVCLAEGQWVEIDALGQNTKHVSVVYCAQN